MTGAHRAGSAPDRRRRWPHPGVAVAIVLCLAAATADVVLFLDGRGAAGEQHDRSAALAAARSAAQDILSYDYRTIDADIRRAQSHATGTFATQYRQSADQLAAQARQNRAIVQASPGQPGVVSADRGQVVVLVFVDQASVKQLEAQKSPTTRIDQNRVRLTMTQVNGHWLVSQLAAL